MSKSRIDKSGKVLAGKLSVSNAEREELEAIFDDYRKSHLEPLTELTGKIQGWLSNYSESYYIAQRLKRKPQILKKLKRLNVRLTQLQDIGGLRIIVERNSDVTSMYDFIKGKLLASSDVEISKHTDYRIKGRDNTGYRALHLILERSGKNIEIQIRSKIQHYWAESIERTSIIYQHSLKEQEGDESIIYYFKFLSDIFFDIEGGNHVDAAKKLELARLRECAENIIKKSDKNRILSSYVNEGIIKTMKEKEKKFPSGINNWIIVFNWNEGNFVSWDIVSRKPDDAVQSYIDWEISYPAADGFEVVLIGSSDVATVRETHSHYFGVQVRDEILEDLNQSIIGFSNKMDIDIGVRQILICLKRRSCWGGKSVAMATLKNHFCKDVIEFDRSLSSLTSKGYILVEGLQSKIYLNIKAKSHIDKYTD